jgi:hypothetical protein
LKRKFDEKPKQEESKKPKSDYSTVKWVEADQDDPYVFCLTEREGDIKCCWYVAGIPFMMLIDSGAEVNIISYNQWTEIKEKQGTVWDASAGSDGKNLRAYGTDKPLAVKGTFKTTIKAGDREVEAKVFVVEGGQKALLSRSTSIDLGILKLGVGVNAISSEFNKMKG